MSISVTAVILAAGRGTRMKGHLAVPKPLASIDGEPLLGRNLRQLHENGIADIIVVTGFKSKDVEECAREAYPQTRFIHNARYEQDRNILSALLGLRGVHTGNSALLLEGDVVFSEKGILNLMSSIQLEHNSWTACGPFRESQKGGILKEADGWIREIRYAEWTPDLAGWKKNLGAIHISGSYLPKIIELFDQYASRDLDQYFIIPWMQNLESFPAKIIDLGNEGASFNTIDEYEMTRRRFRSIRKNLQICLLDVEKLRHVEEYDAERVDWLAKKIMKEHLWIRPLAVSAENIVMDGQHRLEAARLLKLKKIPVVVFNYHDTPIHSLRPEISLDVESIIRNVADGNIYPYKTVKHVLPILPLCEIDLEELRK